MLRKDQKTVLITGCSAGGCGSSLALEFARTGLHVFATARDIFKMSHLKNNSNITLLSLDITSSTSIAEALKAVSSMTLEASDDKVPTLSFLVNNAAVSFTMPFLDTNIPAARQMFDTNVWGFIAVSQAFAPLLIACKGNIANICSVAGYCNSPWMGTYGASKAAMLVLSETLRLELEPFGVGLNSVVTGAVDTKIMVKGAGSDWRLPEGSLYMGIEEVIRDRATGGGVPRKMGPDEFARRVVGDVLGGVRGMTWRGGMATIVRVFTHLPVAMLDMALGRNVGLEKLGVIPAKA